MDTTYDRIRGCLIGGAVGDALGYGVEFLSNQQIRLRYGSAGIRQYDMTYDGRALISDDTQMSLYTAVGFLNAVTDCRNHGFAHWPAVYVEEAYLEWYHTQTTPFNPSATHRCWISDIKSLYEQRAPGNTCLSALRALSRHQPVDNDSKGNGGIMRTAPIALLSASQEFDLLYATQLACDCARITHHHPHGYLPAGLLTYVLYKLVKATEEVTQQRLMRWVEDGVESLREMNNQDGKGSYGEQFGRYLDELLQTSRAIYYRAMLPEDSLQRVVEEQDGGWTGETAWYISLYCVLKHFNSFEQAVCAAVNHSGDSDSTGAIAGNMMGAMHGYNSIPEHFTSHLELSETLNIVADDLYTGELSVMKKRILIPIKDSYIVGPGFYAGEYPIDRNAKIGSQKLGTILRFGITDFIDLTEENELTPYDDKLPQGVNHYRFPIRDQNVPNSFEWVEELIKQIDTLLADESRSVYMHCWGGVGRTGTMIACYYVAHGMGADEALVALREAFKMCAKSEWRIIPETDVQMDFVHRFAKWLQQR